jgi:hypothetical protein
MMSRTIRHCPRTAQVPAGRRDHGVGGRNESVNGIATKIPGVVTIKNDSGARDIGKALA